jgi:hypothetical protein
MGTLTHLTVERIMKVGHIAAFTEPNIIVLENGDVKIQPPSTITYFDFICKVIYYYVIVVYIN